MKAYITKYALTTGIEETGGELSPEYKLFKRTGPEWSWAPYYHKPDWHETREDAVKRANEMRDKAIKSAEKKLAKLRKMRFE